MPKKPTKPLPRRTSAQEAQLKSTFALMLKMHRLLIRIYNSTRPPMKPRKEAAHA